MRMSVGRTKAVQVVLIPAAGLLVAAMGLNLAAMAFFAGVVASVVFLVRAIVAVLRRTIGKGNAPILIDAVRLLCAVVVVFGAFSLCGHHKRAFPKEAETVIAALDSAKVVDGKYPSSVDGMAAADTLRKNCRLRSDFGEPAYNVAKDGTSFTLVCDRGLMTQWYYSRERTWVSAWMFD